MYGQKVKVKGVPQHCVAGIHTSGPSCLKINGKYCYPLGKSLLVGINGGLTLLNSYTFCYSHLFAVLNKDAET